MIQRLILVALLILFGISTPKAQLSMMGIGPGDSGIGVPQNGDILLVDNASILLQTDNASFICRAAGC